MLQSKWPGQVAAMTGDGVPLTDYCQMIYIYIYKYMYICIHTYVYILYIHTIGEEAKQYETMTGSKQLSAKWADTQILAMQREIERER